MLTAQGDRDGKDAQTGSSEACGGVTVGGAQSGWGLQRSQKGVAGDSWTAGGGGEGRRSPRAAPRGDLSPLTGSEPGHKSDVDSPQIALPARARKDKHQWGTVRARALISGTERQRTRRCATRGQGTASLPGQLQPLGGRKPQPPGVDVDQGGTPPGQSASPRPPAPC